GQLQRAWSRGLRLLRHWRRVLSLLTGGRVRRGPLSPGWRRRSLLHPLGSVATRERQRVFGLRRSRRRPRDAILVRGLTPIGRLRRGYIQVGLHEDEGRRVFARLLQREYLRPRRVHLLIQQL